MSNDIPEPNFDVLYPLFLKFKDQDENGQKRLINEIWVIGYVEGHSTATQGTVNLANYLFRGVSPISSTPDDTKSSEEVRSEKLGSWLTKIKRKFL